ncbi:TPA: response regulator [Candidatus Berkelbacteria bacterium]|uniref:Response regulator with CheY-like protein receiver domain and winged-helix DNA-binding-like protein n=1 Tax=Berkelbacteria bacterium GW2011_GWE1_39_12 TaxID=1618337 RepID=A0A0G4B2J5_9BACT|nr:MAG: response regulator with CheY-like protein receiver domain and winged-helix DNA-binding-like protein [Berkelbacteria bacterium GW2011_GWE1_39_12]HBO60763.1 response regulator [Candidatus Berkelbacteria bacterium]
MKILLVDDLPEIRQMLETRLQLEGYEVLTAENGQKGLDCMKENHIDLILTDFQMPVMTGPEMISALRQAQVSIPIILMSGDFSNKDDAQARARIFQADAGYDKTSGFANLVKIIKDLQPAS